MKIGDLFKLCQYVDKIIFKFTELLMEHRFPAMEQRVKHLGELRNSWAMRNEPDPISKYDFCEWMQAVQNIPGYGNDLFLKRAILFFMQLNRRADLFADEVATLPIPADYQVPKMLRHFECIEYDFPIATLISNGRLVPEGSRMECEIRAASIVACKKLAYLADCNCSDVDWYLWSKRNECDDPFHLTVTINY